MVDEAPSVVYIEDDAKLGRLTTRYLETNGVRVTLVADPREGIAAVLRERPDVVLLDLMLPAWTASRCAARCARASTRPSSW
jgi:DNA-binding response OmpR family regulator